MPYLVQKKTKELSNDEKWQLITLLKRFYTGTNQRFIDARVSNSCTFDIVLVKNKGVLLGASYYKVGRLKTPFFKKEIPVIQFGQALKNEFYKDGIVQRSGCWYAKKNIGKLYLLKRAVGLSMIGNPRVFERFTKIFKMHYPNLHDDVRGKKVPIANLLQNVYGESGVELHFDTHYCFTKMDFEPIDITNDWEKYYRSKDESINQFFIDKKIILFKGDRIYDNNIALIACGYRNPYSFKKVQLQKEI
ncbi:MAG: hypothetical protein ABJN84_02600 [Flavobacteriaceae bacterium]